MISLLLISCSLNKDSDFWNEDSINNKENQLGDLPITYADISKAKKLLNYYPLVKLDIGLYNTYFYINM